MRRFYPGERGCAWRFRVPAESSTSTSTKLSGTRTRGGAWAELMTAYGVANTVIKNFPDLFDRVVLLIGGQEAHSIAGSLAITGPLKVRDELIAKRVSSPGKADAPPTASNETKASGAPPTPAGRPPARDAVGLPGEKIPPVGSAPVEAVGVPKSKPDVGAVGAPSDAPESSR